VTVVEGAPQSQQAAEYRKLARDIWENGRFAVPQPMDPEEVRRNLREIAV
jgi:nitrogenase subunit NifH